MGGRSHGHPTTLRPGQRFHPRQGPRRRTITIRVIRGVDVFGVHEGANDSVQMLARRLLERGEDGRGRYYSWLGWAPRRSGYRTTALVETVDGADAMLRLPEWGRDLPLVIPVRFLPQDLRCDHARVELLADLGAASAARLNPRDLRSPRS